MAASGSEAKEKRAKLRALLKADEDLKNAIIFCNRKRDVSVVAKSLKKHGFNAGELHGDMDQRSRMETLESFRNGSLALLVASDVAARGLDIPAVSHVFNYDVPIHAEDYVHRIGRTGRAGLSGKAITLVTPACGRYIDAIEKMAEKKIPWYGDDIDFAAADTERKTRRRGGRRKTETASATQAKPDAPKSDDATVETKNPSRRKSAPSKSSANNNSASKAEKVISSDDVREVVARDRKPADRPKKQPRQQKDSGEQVVGLGDHVPAFLLREVRPKRVLR